MKKHDIQSLLFFIPPLGLFIGALCLPFYSNAILSVRWHPLNIIWIHGFIAMVLIPPLIVYLMQQWHSIHNQLIFKIFIWGLLVNFLISIGLMFLTDTDSGFLLNLIDRHCILFLLLSCLPLIFWQHPVVSQKGALFIIFVVSILVILNALFEILGIIIILIFFIQKKVSSCQKPYWALMFVSVSLMITLSIMGYIHSVFEFSPIAGFIFAILLFFGITETWVLSLYCYFQRQLSIFVLVFHIGFIISLSLALIHHPLWVYGASGCLMMQSLFLFVYYYDIKKHPLLDC